jgi:hypothetical protein
MLHRSDVIQMAMREEDAANGVFLPSKVGDVRHEVVNPEHVLLGELEPEINEVTVGLDLNEQAVPPNLLESPEGDDPELRAALRAPPFRPRSAVNPLMPSPPPSPPTSLHVSMVLPSKRKRKMIFVVELVFWLRENK